MPMANKPSIVSYPLLTWSSLGRWTLINLVIGFSIPLFYYPQGYISLEGWKVIWDDVIYSFVMSMAISGSVGLIERNLNARVPWLKKPGLRFFLEIASVTVFAFTAAMLVNLLFFSLFGDISFSDIPWQALIARSWIPLFIGYGITTFFVSRHFLYAWRNAAVKAEKLRSERYKGQVRFLKDQLNPHFLFNSLNVLTNVVYEDADKAAHFIRELSKFYRYVLEVQDEEVVPLSRELDFARRYASLQQQRFGPALEFSNEITKHKGVIPPLVLQLLLENAIKHNAISEAAPLRIRVYEEKGSLVVWNNCNPKESKEEGTGIGLNNVRERYRLLSEEEVQVEHSQDSFKVSLPQLQLKQL